MSNVFDYQRSAAVLIGTATYSSLPPVAAAGNSLDRMHQLLTGPLCGWPEDRVCVLRDQHVPGELPDMLVDRFTSAADIALFYYVGHGQPDPGDRLCLGLVESRREPERRYTTSLTFDAVRYAMRSSRARFKVILLDCCFSGLALDVPGTLGDANEHRLRGSGACVVAACGPYDRAWYEQESGNSRAYTHFTKRFAEIVESVGAGGPTVLTLGEIADRLIEGLASAGKPVPTLLARDQAQGLPFARYVAPERMTKDELPAPVIYRPDSTLPEGGARHFPDVPVDVWSMTNPAVRVQELLSIGIRLAETRRPRHAKRVWAAAERAIHEEVRDEYTRFNLLTEATGRLRRVDPEQAARLLGLAAACVSSGSLKGRDRERLKELHASLQAGRA